MTASELAAELHILFRSARMLETELQHGRIDTELLEDIDRQMEDGIATDPRSESLRSFVDALRESSLAPRPERLTDMERACQQLKDAIDEVLGKL